MLTRFLLLSCSDNSPPQDLFQLRSLRAVFEDTSESFTERVNLGLPLRDVSVSEEVRQYTNRHCRLSFVDGQLDSFDIALWREHIGTLHIGYLPHSVKLLKLVSCRQRYRLLTRHLPREVTSVELYDNRLYGAIDLQSLPRRIQAFDASFNRLSGTLVLAFLPQSLERLSLNSNVFDKCYYGELSENIRAINLRNTNVRSVKMLTSIHSERKNVIIY